MGHSTRNIATSASFLKSSLIDTGLLFLLNYAFRHAHSAQWIAAIRNILAKQEVRNG